MAKRKTITKGIQARVLNFVQDHPGMHINAARVHEESFNSVLGEISHKQASNGLYQLYKKGLLEKASDGVYFYRGTGITHTNTLDTATNTISGNSTVDPFPNGTIGRHADPTDTVKQNGAPHLYETIGQLQDGTAVVRSDDGELFVLETIEAYISIKASTTT